MLLNLQNHHSFISSDILITTFSLLSTVFNNSGKMTIIENHPAPAVQIPQPNWIMILFLAYSHILAIVGLSYIQVCQWQTLVWSFLLSFWSGIGVTGGAHRLWAHRSYKAHWTIRTFLMLMYSISNQGSIYHWVRDHRVHHKFSETDADPHNVRNKYIHS